MSDFRIRDCKSVSWEQVAEYCKRHQIGILDEHNGREGWQQCQVNVRELRNMHGKFGRQEDSFVELPKGQKLCEQLTERKAELEQGHFPRAEIICSAWQNKPRVIIQRTLSNGELYVADGVTRTFNACYQGELWLDAYVITLNQEREVIG